MTDVQSINVGLGLGEYSGEATTPTTPRAPVPPMSHPAPTESDEHDSIPNSETPTSAHFGGLSGQRPLPTSPFQKSFSSSTEDAADRGEDVTNKRDSQLSLQSDDSQDITMADSDGEGDGGSDGEIGDQEGGRSSKKKKGQRFFCTDFPPCKLSFTRSEHLARHIRKHTGERPFQCHCSRRFSRLDNLRQHAQTVHVNEDIPGDSLAATGTRFQRQIRTDRVSRPSHSRSRASTASSTGSHHRGHGRNLSTSSIGSTVSTLSTISRDDARRRPTPIIMAGDPSKPRLSLDVLRSQASTPPAQSSFYRDESEDLSTPTSTTFSTGGHSPGYGSSIGSPASNARNSGYWDNRGHGRRLSVPSGPMSFQSPQASTYGSPYLSPLASSQASHFSNINASFGSPANASTNAPGGGEAAEADIRRRTWHPPSRTYVNYSRPNVTSHFARPATSGLVYNQTTDTYQPAQSHAPPGSGFGNQTQRLPGIETFDQAPRRPTTPPAAQPLQPARVGSPMQVDQPAQQHLFPIPANLPPKSPHQHVAHPSWDMSLHQGLTKLDIKGGVPGQEGRSWAPPQAAIDQRPNLSETAQPSNRLPIIHQEPSNRQDEDKQSIPPNSNRAKRQGWYAGPPPKPLKSHPRLSPVGSSSSDGVPRTPTAPVVDHSPSIMHSNGFVESLTNQAQNNTEHQAQLPDKSQSQSWPLQTKEETFGRSNHQAMSSLDVLVAAAAEREHHAAPQA